VEQELKAAVDSLCDPFMLPDIEEYTEEDVEEDIEEDTDEN
jgi:hypothetical protein